MLSKTICWNNYLLLVSRYNYGNGVYKNYAYDNQNSLNQRYLYLIRGILNE